MFYPGLAVLKPTKVMKSSSRAVVTDLLPCPSDQGTTMAGGQVVCLIRKLAVVINALLVVRLVLDHLLMKTLKDRNNV
ncbi:hypothetical protein H310_09894 [Aphanomyces invadans]|uniref:Uncharacterized protein n=1 Tax=Aphanomyces invadans TaxID=157072 RepID=A0A024TUQ8_9STRA|nr:hypothetical protein H310_09894 [Aphanomyces invadans]ETV97072.1 hypothetical protein H310_09894 [Aphanomyces invadans]|eukprot:XP_008874318.1 hypothetical protein H310_09894 [Aphanomyces invadans]